jgi:hypothetical protein
MTIRIVGAGLGRTGTHSLKVAIERLLDGPCYHMIEVFPRPDDVAVWQAAMIGEPVDWDALFDGFVATVDWPGAGAWREIAAAYPGAPVLLSTRRTADEWWLSASRTIFQAMDAMPPEMESWHEMAMAMLRRLTPEWPDEAATKAAYERHNAEVRAETAPSRLFEWQPHDGWGPLCAALGQPVPDEPFPVTNTTAEFRANLGLDPV